MFISIYIYHNICTQILQNIQQKTEWDPNNFTCADGNKVYM